MWSFRCESSHVMSFPQPKSLPSGGCGFGAIALSSNGACGTITSWPLPSASPRIVAELSFSDSTKSDVSSSTVHC